jgi:Periplasmic protein involved in polysaccharide export
MKVTAMLLCLLSLLISFPSVVKAEDYVLSAGDVISINIMCSGEIPGSPGNVLGYATLTLKDVVIRPDGMLSVPLVGEINANGLTAATLSQCITRQLRHFYVDPDVTVNVAKLRTTQVYVLGEITKPGVYELGKNHNLLEAIGAASGWTKDAAKTKVFIIRKDQKGDPLQVNLVELLKHGDVSKNYTLSDGDIVYLTKNHRIDVVQDVLPYVWPVYLMHHWYRTP